MAVKKTQMYRKNLDTSETNLYPLTEAQYVSMENGQTVQEILSDRDSDKYTPVITNSSSTFKVGQGDNVDLSSSMKEGAYDSCVLKGKTMVNCIQEPSSQDVVLPYEFADGQYVTINDTKESGALGVELKGQTLVNLIEDDTREGVTLTDSSKDLTLLYTLKPSTQYTLLINIVSTNNDHSGDWWCGLLKTGNWGSESRRYVEGINKLLFTTQADSDCSKFRVRGAGTTFKDAILLEGDWTNIDAPYFTGMTSCKMPILHTVGKNLLWNLNPNNPDNNFSSSGGGTTPILYSEEEQAFYTNRHRMINLIVKPNTTYTFSAKCKNRSEGTSGYVWLLQSPYTLGFGEKTDNWERFSATFTTNSTGAIFLYIYNSVYFKDIQLEESSIVTSYEPHKSSILSLPEEVVLRSLPNGVCDTFNTRTGVYTQKIGELVFDGSEAWESWRTHEQDEVVVGIGIRLPFHKIVQKPKRASFCVCDKLRAGNNSNNDNAWYNYNYNIAVMYPNANTGDLIAIGLPLTDLSSAKNWLEQNPTTIQYELAEPIITKINLPSTLKSWNTTTHVYSEIPENTLYPILSHSNPSYPVILKPSTKYSIVANSYSNNHTNSAINFNLGGATASTTVGNRVTTITTPSTLSNELLTMSGRGNKLNNVMVIEGDVVGDEPYFEGICDCKSPILSNCGKNLVNLDKSNPDGLGSDSGNGTSAIVYDNDKQGFYTKTHRGICANLVVKPNTYYTISADFLLRENSSYSFIWYNPTQSPGDTYNSTDFSATEWRRKSITRLSDENGKINWIAYGGVYFKNLQVEEGTTATLYEPYKSNILSCNGDKIELTEDMFEQGTTGEFSANIGATYHSFKSDSNNRIRTKEIVKVKPNTTYSVICNNGYTARIAGFDINGLCLSEIKSFSSNTTIITTSNNVHYICVILSKISGSISTLDFLQSGLEIREVDKTIVLRSLPNGVCDTLNVETGEYVQRIGEVVLDGSVDEEWTFHALEPSGKYCYKTRYTVDVSVSDSEGHCDKLIYVNGKESPWNKKLNCVSILNTKWLTTYTEHKTLDSYKQWLSQNPLTVQYELTTPIVSTIDVQGYPYAYTNGHVQLSSGHNGQSLTPKVEYSLSANKTGQINSNTKRVSAHQKQLDDFEAMMLTSMVQSAYDKAILQFDYEMQMMSLGGE